MEFLSIEVTELVADVIVESMHTQCNIDGYNHLLLDSLINYGKAVSFSNQKDVFEICP